MDPNVVQVQIVEESMLSTMEPFLIGLGGVILGALLSWWMIRWQIKRSHELELRMRQDAENEELENMCRVLKTGVIGYWKYMETTVQEIKSTDNEKPAFFITDPAAHRLPGYEEVLHLIMKIRDVRLLEAVMATNHSIRDFGAILQVHNDYFFMKYQESRQRALHSNDEIDMSQAKLLLKWTSNSMGIVKKRLEVVESNVIWLRRLLDKKTTAT